MRRVAWLVLGVFSTLVWLGGAGTGLWLVHRTVAKAAAPAPIVYHPGAHPTTPWRGEVSSLDRQPDATPKMPEVQRAVPRYEARLLAGCSKTDLDTIAQGLEEAIGLGAPLYNEGDFSGSYHAYDSAAATIARSVQKTCKGPATALEQGRARASKRTSLPEQAWALRDSFDGLLDVIDRKGTEL